MTSTQAQAAAAEPMKNRYPLSQSHDREGENYVQDRLSERYRDVRPRTVEQTEDFYALRRTGKQGTEKAAAKMVTQAPVKEPLVQSGTRSEPF